MAHATLLVIQGTDQGMRFVVGDEAVGIGRGVRNDIRILDTEVSRQHATLQRAEGRYVLADRNSSNGTFVNGERVQTRTLHGGDQIQVGRTMFLFSEETESSRGLSGADRVDFVGQAGRDDRSSIVGQVHHEEAAPALIGDETAGDGVQILGQTVSGLQALYRISEEAVSTAAPLEQQLKRALDLSIEVVGADRGCVLLTDPQTSEIAPQVVSHRRGLAPTGRMPVSRSIVDYVVQNRQGVRTSDARSDQRFEPGQSIVQAGIREAVCVPMQGRYELMGVIYVDITTPPERVVLEENAGSRFDDEQLRLLLAIGRQLALAVENDRYQKAYVKAERLAAVGQTIAMLSHHIKNILQGVRGGSYLIDVGLRDGNDELVHKGWNIVEKNQDKIYHLVMDMLTFSTERKPALERGSLNETVSEVCELLQARAEECRITLERQLAEDVPASMFDPEGIHRAVLNIVGNAIEALDGSEGGAVQVQTGYDAATDELFIAVTDNGPGIPEEQLDRVFEIFESTKGARGTGIGLPVSRKIIREHGGDITIESRPGAGCRFLLVWPRIDDEQRGTESRTVG